MGIFNCGLQCDLHGRHSKTGETGKFGVVYLEIIIKGRRAVVAAITCHCAFIVCIYLIFPLEIERICLHVRFAGVGTHLAARVQLSHLANNYNTKHGASEQGQPSSI